jgi:sterol desaturase/sphingolipid hydroxylase (fatty acid hydroxylase superfamily)
MWQITMWDGVLYFPKQLAKVFLAAGSVFSLTSLVVALVIAALILVHRRRRQNRPLRLRTIVRGLFPGWLVRSASFHADVAYFYFHVFAYGLIFGWAVVSYKLLSTLVIEGLVAVFGAVQPTTWPDLAARIVITLALFLAYEFGYWVDHYLKHRVPALWELHKVHHSATVLTPLTGFRLHPLDALIFTNILALSLGVANGVANYAFGQTTYAFTIGDTNLILVLFVHLYVHLQHTHLWIAFTGVAGRILLSPAHHQIHHSNNPIHFDKNLGSCLAIWDWLFGTLYIPKKEPENISFGVAVGETDVHTITELTIAPVQRAAALLAAPFATRADAEHPPAGAAVNPRSS